MLHCFDKVANSLTPYFTIKSSKHMITLYIFLISYTTLVSSTLTVAQHPTQIGFSLCSLSFFKRKK